MKVRFFVKQSKAVLKLERKNLCVMPILGPPLTFSTRKAGKRKWSFCVQLYAITAKFSVQQIFTDWKVIFARTPKWIFAELLNSAEKLCRGTNGYRARQLESTLWGYIRYSGWLLRTINEAILVNPLEP